MSDDQDDDDLFLDSCIAKNLELVAESESMLAHNISCVVDLYDKRKTTIEDFLAFKTEREALVEKREDNVIDFKGVMSLKFPD